MWTIECLVNTAVISNDCAHDLFEEAQDYEGELWGDYEEVIDKNVGLLRFNPDHMEHMDYLATHDNVIKILKRHNVKGDICFGDLEGDHAGSFWGYRFDGKGGMKHLRGRLLWEEKEEVSLEGKTFVLTGSLPNMTRQEAEDKIRELGGKVSGTISTKTDYLVAGDKPGSKLQKATKLGIKVIDSEEFLEILGED